MQVCFLQFQKKTKAGYSTYRSFDRQEYDTRTSMQTKFKLSLTLSPLCNNKTIIAPQMEVYKI